jgi:pyrroline-5-carboxylate reductase
MLHEKKIAILGCGNIGSAIADGIAKTESVKNSDVYLTRRKAENLQKYADKGFNITSNNKEAVKNSEILILGITPQQMDSLMAEIKDELVEGKHVIYSIVSGATIEQIKSKIEKNVTVLRVMPNLALAIQQSMTCISGEDNESEEIRVAKELFDKMGKTIIIEENLMVPATALVACGIAFFMRAIRAASQGGIEIGFHSEEALVMSAQTALGAAQLLLTEESHPESEVDKVTTPRGCTIVGLNQMEHSGFSSSLIKGIVMSAEKAETLYNGKNK